jgi:hypothetical protein
LSSNCNLLSDSRSEQVSIVKQVYKPRRWYSSPEATPEPGTRVHHDAVTLRYTARVAPIEAVQRPGSPPPARVAPLRRSGRLIVDIA